MTQKLHSWAFNQRNDNLCSQKTCIQMVTAALSIMARIGNNLTHLLKYPSTDEWLNKIGSTYSLEYYLAAVEQWIHICKNLDES